MASAHIAINGLSGRHNQQVRRLVDDIVEQMTGRVG